MSERHRLPNRRNAVTVELAWSDLGGVDHKLHVTYGFDDAGIVREVFCAGFRADSSFCALVNDACILLSRLLQHGEQVEDLAGSLIENRAEGARSGPPASMLGAIIRRATALQQYVRN